MNKITRTLNRIKDNKNLTKRQQFIISATDEHIEHIEKQCCEDCVHYTDESTILGAIDYKDCKHNFNCSVIRNNNFKAKDRE